MEYGNVWVKGVPERLTRIKRGENYLPVNKWTMTKLTNRIIKQNKRGSLEISYKDPQQKKSDNNGSDKKKDSE